MFCLGCESAPADVNPVDTDGNSPAVHPAVLGPSSPDESNPPIAEILDTCEGRGCDGVWLISTSCVLTPYLLEARQVAFGGDERPLIGLIKLDELPSAVVLQLPTGFSPLIYVAERGHVIDFQWEAFSNQSEGGLEDNIRKIRNLLVRTGVVKGDPASFRNRVEEDIESRILSDYSAADLSGRDLSNRRLRKANFSGSDLSRADLSGSDLSGAFFFHTDLTGANLSGTDFTQAKFRQTICPDGSITDTGCR